MPWLPQAQAVLFVGRRQGEEFGIERVDSEIKEQAILATRPYRNDITLLSSFRQNNKTACFLKDYHH
jgi:hypothetical protein